MTEEKLKAALIKAHNKGDKQAAELFARKIKELRAVQSASIDSNQIPIGTGAENIVVSMSEQPAQQQAPSMMDNIVGAADAGFSALTGATTGAIGYGIGALEGLAGQALGNLTPEQARQTAERYAANATRDPATARGAEILQTVGDALSVLPPVVAGFTPQQVAGAAQAARATAVAPMASVPDVRLPQAAPQAGRSVGAAEIPVEQVRRQAAQELPVKMNLTKGMATQDFEQQRFERETAKDPVLGGELRDRYNELNQGINQNFDAFIDATGTNIPDTTWRLDTGNKVIKALEDSYAAEKTKVNNAYNAARAKGETQEIIDVSPLAQYLNENRVDVTVAPVVKAVADEAKRLEVADGDIADGSFRILPMTVEQSETLRQRVNALTDSKNGQDLRRAAQIKRLIDQSQDQAGGRAFQSARKMRQQLANKFENLAIIDQILDTEGNYLDRRIAAEDIVTKAVVNGSIEDVKNLRRVLSTAGDDGMEALADVRAAVVRHIRDEATKNVGRDPMGNPLISAAGFDRAMKNLDKNGKLDLMFGKTEAAKLRLLNDVAKDILVSQPNAVNQSNTASVVLAAFDLMASAGTGVPAPILSSLKLARDKIKTSKTEKRVKEALK